MTLVCSTTLHRTLNGSAQWYNTFDLDVLCLQFVRFYANCSGVPSMVLILKCTESLLFGVSIVASSGKSFGNGRRCPYPA